MEAESRLFGRCDCSTPDSSARFCKCCLEMLKGGFASADDISSTVYQYFMLRPPCSIFDLHSLLPSATSLEARRFRKHTSNPSIGVRLSDRPSAHSAGRPADRPASLCFRKPGLTRRKWGSLTRRMWGRKEQHLIWFRKLYFGRQ